MGWTKCNVDGSVREVGRLAGCGRVFRDATGTWVLGFARNLGLSSVIMVELWAILTALDLAWTGGIKKLWLEADSRVAIQFTKERVTNDHPLSTNVMQIRDYFQRDWHIKVTHAYRESNKVADFLAGHAHLLQIGLHVLQYPPPGCGTILLDDLAGVSFFRTVVS